MNPALQRAVAILICQNRFVQIVIIIACSCDVLSLLRQVINAENHILRRYVHDSAIRRLQQVIR